MCWETSRYKDLVKDSYSLKQTNKQSSTSFKYAPHQNLAVPPSTTVSPLLLSPTVFPDSYSALDPTVFQTFTQSHSLPRVVLSPTVFPDFYSVPQPSQPRTQSHSLPSLVLSPTAFSASYSVPVFPESFSVPQPSQTCAYQNQSFCSLNKSHCQYQRLHSLMATIMFLNSTSH